MNRIDLASGLPVNCMNCKFFNPETLSTCKAYPDGIPVPILSGDVQHDSPLPNDRGIQFQSATTRQDSASAMTRLIEDAIGSVAPISEVLGLPQKDEEGNLYGYFRDSALVYEYRVVGDDMLTAQRLPQKRADSILQGYHASDIAGYLPNEYVMGMIQSKCDARDAILPQSSQSRQDGYCQKLGLDGIEAIRAIRNQMKNND